MVSFTLRRVGVLVAFTLLTCTSFAQLDIFEIMQRRDLRIDQIEQLAKRYFDSTGTERGTGYKQYQRWLYDLRFHLNEFGFQLPPNYDWEVYEQWKKYDGGGKGNGQNLLAGTTDWLEKGPSSWNRTSGWNPGVGRVTSIAVHPLDTTLIYVTSPGGGVWRSTTGGNNWTPLTDANGSWMNMFSVAVDPQNVNVVYAGSNAAQVIKSTDKGATWTSVGRLMSGTVSKILIHPTNSNIIFTAAQNGVFRSTDGGVNWTKTYANSIEDIEFKPGDPNIMYATGPFSPSVIRSTDGGLTWVGLTATEGITNAARALVSVSPADPNRVYVVQAFGNEFGRMYVSTNSGASFTVSVTGSSASCTNFFGYETTGCGTGGQAGYDMAMCVNPNNANEIYIGGIIVFKSTDGGKTFAAQTAWSYPNSIGYNHADVHALEWRGQSVYSGSDGGIYISTDRGDNWKDLSKGLGVRQFYRIANSKTNSQLFTGGAQDNGSSLFKNGTWYDWLGADGMDGIISPFDENIIFGTSQYGQLYRSNNGGSSYTTLTKPSNGDWVTPLQYHEANKAIYGGWTGVFKSYDNGNSWTNISGTNISTTIAALAVAPSDTNTIYASKSTTLYYTTNGGATWMSTTLPSTINAIAVSPINPRKIWVACNSTSNRVFASTDGGVTFTNISGNLPSIISRAIAVASDESVYAGLNVGMYYLAPNSTSWTNITGNLPTVAINDIDIHAGAGLVRIGTYGRGVWERALEGTTISIPTCSAPTNLGSSEIIDTTAKVSWAAVSGAAGYKVEYKANSSTTWLVATANTTSTFVTLTGLKASTLYDWRVSTICSASASDVVAAQFTTAATIINCGTPSGLAASGLTETSATLGWTAVSGATAYTIDYKLSSSTTWTNFSQTYTSTSLTLNGLNAGATYDWRVAAVCGTAASAYATSQFQLIAPCTTPGALNTTNITESGATITWGSVAGAASYAVEYKASSSTSWITLLSATTATNATLTGLIASTMYDWRVRSNCSINASTYAVASFTTASPPTCVDNYESNNTSKQSKSVGWSSKINATIDKSADEDWFKLSTGSSSSTNIRVTLSELPNDYDMYLYDKNLRLIGSSINSGTTAEALVFNTNSSRATYFVQVIGKSGSANVASCYAFLAESSVTPYAPVSGVAYFSDIQEVETTVFPNPVSTKVTLRFMSQATDNATLQLVNASGVTVRSNSVAVQKGANQSSINVSDIKPGLYLIKVKNSHLNITKQVIVVH
jgi:hypothetical protein